jgi:hypothetical protein
MKTAGACFNVNGDASSVEVGPENPSSVFVVATPFTIHVIAWHTPSAQTSGIQFLRNGQIYGPSWAIDAAGLMGGMEGKYRYRYDVGDILQIRYNRSTEQRRHLIWVYVRPIPAYYHTPNDGTLVNASRQSIVTFGGNVNLPSGLVLRVNGKAHTALNKETGAVGNVYLVTSYLTARAVTWTTTSGDETTTFAIIKNGVILVTFELTGTIGVIVLNGVIFFNPDNTIQVRHVGGTSPGPCLLTFYYT